MRNRINALRVAAALAVLAPAVFLSSVFGQIQTAGDLLVDVDATAQAEGPLSYIANNGTMGGGFEAGGGGLTVPSITPVNGNGTPGIRFDGGDYMQHVESQGGALLPAAAGLVGTDPTRSIEVWVFNPSIAVEETMVSIGKRGGPVGSNCSFGYGSSGVFGAVGKWGAPDIGWVDAGGAPAAGQWHHLVYTFDGTTTRLYVDGVLVNSEVLAAGTINTHAGLPIQLGAQLDSNGTTVTAGLRGTLTLGRVRIHDGVLSDANVLNNYTVETADFDGPTSLAVLGGPIHRYSFDNPAAADATGATIDDSVGTADGIVKNGTGTTTFTGSRLTLSGGDLSIAPYVDLPNGLLSSHSVDNGGSGEITVEGFVRVTGNRAWSRIFDFGSTAGGELNAPGGTGEGLDYLFLSAQVGGDVNTHRVEVRNQDGATGGANTADFGTFTFNTDMHFAVTWREATGEINVYENGLHVLTTTTDERMSAINDVNVWLGRSNWPDNNMQGEFDEFRIYDRVLSAVELLRNYETGAATIDIGQVQTAGDLLVDVDATVQTEGALAYIVNTGTMGGGFEARGGGLTVPSITPVNGNGTPGIRLDGNDYLQHVESAGGALLPAAAGLVGIDPTRSIEVWVFNPSIAVEETMVSIGKRGGPVGSNCSFGYGSSGVFGAVGMWGAPDIGWVDAGGAPAAGRWHHLVYTFDGTTTRLYVDGALVNSEVLAAGTINTHAGLPIQFGAQLDANGTTVTAGLRGTLTLGRVRIHDGVLSDAQVFNNHYVEAADFQGPTSLAILGGPIHRYSFNDPAAADATGATIDDSVGTADGVVKNGTGTTTLTGSRLTLSGGDLNIAPYVDLPNGLLSSHSVDNGGSGEITVEGFVRVTGNRAWSRIFDFGSTAGGELNSPGGTGEGLDYLFLSAQVGTDVNVHRVEVRNQDGATGGANTADLGTFTFNTDMHFAVTWREATGEINVYENGLHVLTTTTDERMSAINDVNVWLGRSNWPDNNMQGEFDEFRIYDRVLSAVELLHNYETGPDTLDISGPGALLEIRLVLDRTTMTAGTFQQAQVLADYERALGVDVTTAPGTVYESSDIAVLTVTAAGRLDAVTPGSATVTVTFGEKSVNAAITVNPRVTTLEHRYSFDADASDSVGSADGTLQGSAVVSEGQVVMAAATQDHMQLPADIVAGYEAVTVEAWASFGVNGNWNRLFDFGNTNSAGQGRNYLMMSPHSGAGDTRIGIADGDPGFNNEQNATTPGNLDNQQNVQIVAVFYPAAGFQALYLNGVLAAANSNTTIQLSGVDDQLNYIGRSLYAAVGDSWLSGSVDEFRIYNGALSPQQIAVDAASGPTNMIPDPGALQSVQLQAGTGMLVEFTQTARLLGDFANINDVNLVGYGAPVFTSGDPAVFTVDAKGLVTAVGAGTATLTGAFGGFEDTLSITVTNLPQPLITLVHRYSFNQEVGSTVEPDRVGSADGAVLGTAAYNGTGQLLMDGATGSYVNLPNGIISALANATFEAWVAHNSTRDWERIFDFGISTGGEDVTGTGERYVFLTPRAGATGNPYRFAARPSNAGAESPVLNGPGPLPLGQETHLVVTYNETLSVARLYANGVRVASGPVTIPLSTIPDVNNWLGRAQFNDPYFTGSFNEFRIYTGAMDDDQVAASFAAGPEAEIGGVRLSIVNNGDGTITISWPVSAADYFLEFSSELGPLAVWDLVFEIPVQDGDFYRVTLSADQAAEYYRLSK